ncbi:hypothetical protein V1527DRAFT_376200, partial [Lipomyces starkeyi]
NLLVRVEIRDQIETASLCTAISRSCAGDGVHQEEEEGTKEKCSCNISSCSWFLAMLTSDTAWPIYITCIHPRWRVQATIPAINVPSHHID